MAQIQTAQQLKEIATPYSNIDVEYFENNIEFWQYETLQKVLTTALYDEILLQVDTATITPANQLLIDKYIKFAEAFGVSFLTMKKDVITQLSNQGVMANRTDFSNSEKSKMVLKEYKEREFIYLKDLGCFLLENKVDYPLFDYENTFLAVDFRDFVIL